MADEKKQNPLRRFLGKVKNFTGQYGTFQKVLIDNPVPNNEDGSANQYYKGSLLWLDAATGKKYLVKQMAVMGVPAKAAENGFISSIAIDLDSEYHVQEL